MNQGASMNRKENAVLHRFADWMSLSMLFEFFAHA